MHDASNFLISKHSRYVDMLFKSIEFGMHTYQTLGNIFMQKDNILHKEKRQLIRREFLANKRPFSCKVELIVPNLSFQTSKREIQQIVLIR